MHDAALTTNAAALFRLLHRFPGFYLVGGTALALQIGHRVSVDLDCFTEQPLPAELLARVKRVFHSSSIAVTYRAPDQLHLIVHGVQVTFFHYMYPVLDPFVRLHNTPLCSIREIAAMKAFAIGKRIAYKDYVDWYFLLAEQHVTLAEVVRHAKQKFGADFNDRLFLGQLVSLDDVPTQKVDFLREAPSRNDIARFLQRAVKVFGASRP